MPAPGSLRWARASTVGRLAEPLLATVTALNLLWPTSAPLRANGAPLNTWTEFALAAVFIGWLGLLLSFAVLRQIDPCTAACRSGSVDRWLTASALLLGALLLFVRVLAPPEEGFTACYSTPELPSVPCLFLADGWAPSMASGVPQRSRIEEQLLFDPNKGYTWRLGAFNDLAFNIYGSESSDTLDTRRESFRRNGAHPFEVTFAWDAATGDRVARLYPSGTRFRIAYRGEVAVLTDKKRKILPFSRDRSTEVIRVRADEFRSLRLRYANFSCPDAACHNELTMDPLPFAEAVFRIDLSPPAAAADEVVPLDQQLLAQAAPPLSPLRWGRLIESAFVLVTLARLATWMVRVGLARRPSVRLVVAAVLLACVLVGVFAPGRLWDPLLTDLGTPLGSVPFWLVAVPAFLGAIGLLAVVLRMRASGYAFRATAPGRLLLVSSAALAPVAVVGVILACVGVGYVVSGPILGPLRDEDRSWSRFLDPSFVLMALPIVLGVVGVLVVVALRRPCTVGAIAPALLVLATAGLLMQLPAAVATMASVAPVPARGFLDASSRITDILALPPRDDIELFSVGDDPLTYASWAKDVLHSPRRFVDPTVVLSKPFFVYLRAARYALFGDGEIYALAWSKAVICWVVAVGGVLGLAAVGAAHGACREPGVRSRVGRGLIAILSAVAWIWLSYSVSMQLGLSRLSEGPAATAALLSFGVLIGASFRTPILYVAAGAMFGLSLLYRTSNLPLALLGLAIVWLAPTSGVSRWLRNSAAYLLPIAVAALAIWLHAGAPLSVPPEVAEYVAKNTGAPQAPPGSYFHGLVPNMLTLQIACSALFAIVAALVMPGTTSTRLRVGALGLAVIFGTLIPLLPQRAAPYYPRSLMTAYYAIAFVPLALLIYLCRTWPRNAERADKDADQAWANGVRHALPFPSRQSGQTTNTESC